jgi:hypothetical protein
MSEVIKKNLKIKINDGGVKLKHPFKKKNRKR